MCGGGVYLENTVPLKQWFSVLAVHQNYLRSFKNFQSQGCHSSVHSLGVERRRQEFLKLPDSSDVSPRLRTLLLKKFCTFIKFGKW